MKKKTIDEQLKELMFGELKFNPLAFVMFNYPWKQKGTPLEFEQGPDQWQAETLKEIGDLTKRQETGDYGNVIQYAIKAGRGPGKTALFAWLMSWFIGTRPGCTGVVTANTKVQLETKTWRELAKWHGMALNKHWFDWKQSKYKCTIDPDYPETWFIVPIVWTKENPQSIAGTHESYVIYLMDEASTIPDIIKETLEGGLTDDHVLWVVGGNPTETSGWFKECWGEFAHRWITKTVDIRNTRRASKPQVKEQIQHWIEDYGEDHDFVRVWVKGEFPRASVKQFIPDDVVDLASKRTVDREIFKGYPIIIGVDTARHGASRNVIYVRQGYYTHEMWKYEGRIENTMEMVGYILAKVKYYTALRRGIVPYTMIDVGGVGFGIIDRLRELGTLNIFDVNFGINAGEPNKYSNKRAEMYALTKKWLMEGGCIPNDETLKKGLTAVHAGQDKKERLVLEGKKEMAARGEKELDEADALACTFCVPIGLEIRDTRTESQKIMDFVEQNAAYYNTVTQYIDFGSL